MIRSKEMDIAKGIGILAVILGHVGVSGLKGILYAFHLPLFYIITGYFYSGWGIKIFVRKKIKGYIVPYFLFAGIITLFSLISGFGEYSTLKEYLVAFLIQKRFTTLWFLTSLFLGIMIFTCLDRICKNKIVFSLIAITVSLVGLGYASFGGASFIMEFRYSMCRTNIFIVRFLDEKLFFCSKNIE